MKTTITAKQAKAICEQIVAISNDQFADEIDNESREQIVKDLVNAAAHIGYDDPLKAWFGEGDFDLLDYVEKHTEHHFGQLAWGALANFTKPSNLAEALHLLLDLTDGMFQAYRESFKPKLRQLMKSRGNLKDERKFTLLHKRELKEVVPKLREKYPKWSAEALGNHLADTGNYPVSGAHLAKNIRALFPDFPRNKAGRRPKQPAE